MIDLPADVAGQVMVGVFRTLSSSTASAAERSAGTRSTAATVTANSSARVTENTAAGTSAGPRFLAADIFRV